MFGGKDWFEIDWVEFGVSLTLLLRVNVVTSGKCVGFGAEFTGAEFDDHVELGEEFRPASLAAGKYFCGGEILKVFVIGQYFDSRYGAFEIVAPGLESIVDRQQLFVVNVVVQFR